jgi:hypothetical protein
MIAHIVALIAVLATGVIYGTDTFCALVLRPALARVDDAALTAVAGNIHRFGDKRLPVPGIIGILGSAVTSVFAALIGHTLGAALAGVALVLLVIWLVLYLRISAPINRVLSAAADKHETLDNARALQKSWESIIVLRATLQGLAVLALCISLLS